MEVTPDVGKIAILTGTRPGIVKFAPLVRELEARNASYLLIHSGQHYSPEMDAAFFRDLELPQPHHRLDGVEKATLQGAQTAEMLRGIESILMTEEPRVFIVGGDCNTHLAGALAARKLHIPLAHVEAGMRSWDWRVPEEHNRRMIDHISEILLVHNEVARANLESESVMGRIFVVGTTAADAVTQNLEIAHRKSGVLEAIGLSPDSYFLATCHRQENVDHSDVLAGILRGFEEVGTWHQTPVVFPIHPRTRKRMGEFGMESWFESLSNVIFVDPVGYFDFLCLLSHCRLLLTDSGGGQQESCILQKPCVTLRSRTEWTETVEIGANLLAGNEREPIVAAVEEHVANRRQWTSPFGDGKAAGRILDIVEDELRDGIRMSGQSS